MSARALAHVALLGELELLTGNLLHVAEALAWLMPDDALKVAASTARVRAALQTRPEPVTLSTRWVIELLGRLQDTAYVARDYDPFRHRMPIWSFPGMVESSQPHDQQVRRLLASLQKTQAQRLRQRSQRTHIRIVQQREAMMQQQARLAAQQRREVS